MYSFKIIIYYVYDIHHSAFFILIPNHITLKYVINFIWQIIIDYFYEDTIEARQLVT